MEMDAANDHLFSIDKITHGAGTVAARLGINKDSSILKGHFPGQPVIPGACMLQIVKQVLANALGNPMRLKKADHLKFMSMIDPESAGAAQLDLSYKPMEDEQVMVIARLSSAGVIFFKFQGSFVRGER